MVHLKQSVWYTSCTLVCSKAVLHRTVTLTAEINPSFRYNYIDLIINVAQTHVLLFISSHRKHGKVELLLFEQKFVRMTIGIIKSEPIFCTRLFSMVSLSRNSHVSVFIFFKLCLTKLIRIWLYIKVEINQIETCNYEHQSF